MDVGSKTKNGCSGTKLKLTHVVFPDYDDPSLLFQSGYHCRLCGKHSNSERQWQQHISSEKHKDRVFSCEGEDEALTWSYRFPGTCFELCPK